MSERYGAVILGAGPAGLYLAIRLLRVNSIAPPLVVEREQQVGGLARSFVHNGLTFDLGSHRLHPSIRPEILADIRGLLGCDLTMRPRNGRIYLFGRYVSFPISPRNLLNKLPSFVAGTAWDAVTRGTRKKKNKVAISFEDVLLEGLGPTLCHAFYFPYARKLWGLEPSQIDQLQAQRRVAADTAGKIFMKILATTLGRTGPGRSFYYPRMGFGQISEALACEVRRLGGQVDLGCGAQALRAVQGGWEVQIKSADGKERDYEAPLVFSTIPTSTLLKLLGEIIPPEIASAISRLRHRGMLLVYLELARNQFTPFDAHYFPGADVVLSRLSEPKNYSASPFPTGKTGLCAEIPSAWQEDLWNRKDDEIVERVLLDLDHVGLPARGDLTCAFVLRVPFVYPIYELGIRQKMDAIEAFLDTQPRLIVLGRQGLFLHDNTHHTMEAAWHAAACVNGTEFDYPAWRLHRASLRANIVED
jgi:protoporphyrinogen oxidase